MKIGFKNFGAKILAIFLATFVFNFAKVDANFLPKNFELFSQNFEKKISFKLKTAEILISKIAEFYKNLAREIQKKSPPDLREFFGDEKVVLNFWSLNYGRDIFGWALEDFEKKFPNAKINLRVFENYQTFAAAFFAEKSNRPDIFIFENSQFNLLKKLISPAPRELFSRKKITENFVSAACDSFCTATKVWAIPIEISSTAMFFNAALLRDDRVTVGDAPEKTWEKFLKNAQNFQKFSDAQKIFTLFSPAQKLQILELFILQKGNFKQKLAKQKVAFEALKFLKFFENSKIKSEAQILQNFLNGDLAVIFGDEKMYKKIEQFFENSAEKKPNSLQKKFFKIARVPQFSLQNPKTISASRAFAVSANSQNPRAAWATISFLTNFKNSRDFILKTGARSSQKYFLRDDFFGEN